MGDSPQLFEFYGVSMQKRAETITVRQCVYLL